MLIDQLSDKLKNQGGGFSYKPQEPSPWFGRWCKVVPREAILEQVKNLVLDSVAKMPVVVYLYGSWARGEEKRTSDIDIAIWCENELPVGTLSNIRLALEESTIPYRVDVVDLSKLDQPIRDKVLSEGIIWKDCNSG